MAVVEATTANGHYQTYSSSNAALATVLSEVLTKLSTQEISLNQTKFVLTYDYNLDVYAFVAICRKS